MLKSNDSNLLQFKNIDSIFSTNDVLNLERANFVILEQFANILFISLTLEVSNKVGKGMAAKFEQL